VVGGSVVVGDVVVVAGPAGRVAGGGAVAIAGPTVTPPR
jgi:hypothetical protein